MDQSQDLDPHLLPLMKLTVEERESIKKWIYEQFEVAYEMLEAERKRNGKPE